MKFLKEVQQENAQMWLNWHKNELRRSKEEPTEEELILWEVGNSIETDKVQACISNAWGIQVHTDPLTIEEFDELMEGINSTFAEYNYTLDVNNKEGKTMRFFIPDEPYSAHLTVQLVARSCNIVETGRLVPEKKQVCNFLKGAA